MTIGATTSALADAHMDESGVPGPEQDPYIWLEEARSDEALDWVRDGLMAHAAKKRAAKLAAE